jgi:hypothetical protein
LLRTKTLRKCRGDILLQVNELHSFESNPILAFYNIFAVNPKKYLLQEFHSILKKGLPWLKRLN